MTGTTPGRGVTRKLRAAIIGVGLDGPLRPVRIMQGEECFVIGGSDETRANLFETMLRLEVELQRLDQRLGDLDPESLAEMAQRIDCPELEAIAVRLADGLAENGRTFGESTPEELTALATLI
jgi:hypothetical protein